MIARNAFSAIYNAACLEPETIEVDRNGVISFRVSETMLKALETQRFPFKWMKEFEFIPTNPQYRVYIPSKILISEYLAKIRHVKKESTQEVCEH